MYCVIYKFIIIEGKEKQFISSWKEVTEGFKAHCGALGSRLHKSRDGEYIAYAQWLSKEARDKAVLPESVVENSYKEMRNSCESVETLYEMTPVSDLLVHLT